MRNWLDNHTLFDSRRSKPVIFERTIETLHGAKLVKKFDMTARRKHITFIEKLIANLQFAFTHQLCLAINTSDESDGVAAKSKSSIVKYLQRVGVIEDMKRGYSYGKTKKDKALYSSTKLKPAFEVNNWIDVEDMREPRGAVLTYKYATGLVVPIHTEGLDPDNKTFSERCVKYSEPIMKLCNKKFLKRTNADITGGFVRKYSGGLNRGGRVYAAYQTLKKEDRAKILIDGQETVELDYPENHLRMIMHFLKEDPRKTFYDSFDMPRDKAKKAMMVLLNAEDPEKVFCDKRKNAPFRWTKEKYESFVEIFKEKHPQLIQFIGVGVGAYLQSVEGDVASVIMREFANEGRVCLPVHDSFIVKKEDAEHMKEYMKEAWANILSSHMEKGQFLWKKPVEYIHPYKNVKGGESAMI